MMTMQVAYATSYLVVEELPSDISICVLEIADHVYSPLSFYLSKSAFMVNYELVDKLMCIVLKLLFFD